MINQWVSDVFSWQKTFWFIIIKAMSHPDTLEYRVLAMDANTKI